MPFADTCNAVDTLRQILLNAMYIKQGRVNLQAVKCALKDT